jgi:hypothetical protein
MFRGVGSWWCFLLMQKYNKILNLIDLPLPNQSTLSTTSQFALCPPAVTSTILSLQSASALAVKPLGPT